MRSSSRRSTPVYLQDNVLKKIIYRKRILTKSFRERVSLKILIPIVFSIFGLVISTTISLRSLDQANKAIDLAKKANEIANDGNQIQKEISKTTLEDSKYARLINSQKFISDAYDSIYDSEKYSQLMYKIKNNVEIKNLKELQETEYILDIFEGLGTKYCHQVIERGTFDDLYLTLNYICNNNQIVSFYGGHKNATATLCYEYFPDSKFAQTSIEDKSWCKALTHK